MSKSNAEETLEFHLKAAGITGWEREYKFHPRRKWRIDFFFRDDMLAVEVEGGAYSNGRHTRGAGFVADIEKYNAMTLAGIRLLRFPTHDVMSGAAISVIERALGLVREVEDGIPF